MDDIYREALYVWSTYEDADLKYARQYAEEMYDTPDEQNDFVREFARLETNSKAFAAEVERRWPEKKGY